MPKSIKTARPTKQMKRIAKLQPSAFPPRDVGSFERKSNWVSSQTPQNKTGPVLTKVQSKMHEHTAQKPLVKFVSNKISALLVCSKACLRSCRQLSLKQIAQEQMTLHPSIRLLSHKHATVPAKVPTNAAGLLFALSEAESDPQCPLQVPMVAVLHHLHPHQVKSYSKQPSSVCQATW